MLHFKATEMLSAGWRGLPRHLVVRIAHDSHQQPQGVVSAFLHHPRQTERLIFPLLIINKMPWILRHRHHTQSDKKNMSEDVMNEGIIVKIDPAKKFSR